MIREWLEQMINEKGDVALQILDYEAFNELLAYIRLHFKQETASKPLEYKYKHVWVRGMYYEYGTEYSIYVYRIYGATCAIKFRGDAATWIFANGGAL